MESIEKTPNPGESEWDMTFTFRLLPGKTQMTDYALRLMMASALPNEVKQYAMAVAKDIAHRRETSLPVCLVDEPDRIEELVKIEKIENFISNLNSLCKTDKFTPKIFRALQKMIREEILSDIESDEDISNEEADKTISTPEEHNNIVVEVQKIVDEAVDEFLKGEEEDKVLKRNNQFVLTQSSGREEESLSSGKCNSAVNMGIDKNMIHSDREGNEIQLFSNLGHQESEEENDDHYNENVMDSRLNESKQLPTLDDVRPVLNKKSPESDDEKADNNILYLKRKESQDLKNNMLTEDHGEYSGEEDCEGRNDNVLYPERNKLQNFMDIEDRSFPTDDQVDYNEQEESYNIEYLEKQPTPNSTAINVNRPTQDILLGNREDVNAHYSVTSQECSNRFTPEDFTGSQDNEFKYYREHSETEGISIAVDKKNQIDISQGQSFLPYA